MVNLRTLARSLDSGEQGRSLSSVLHGNELVAIEEFAQALKAPTKKDG